jgi:hypothetical protein
VYTQRHRRQDLHFDVGSFMDKVVYTTLVDTTRYGVMMYESEA